MVTSAVVLVARRVMALVVSVAMVTSVVKVARVVQSVLVVRSLKLLQSCHSVQRQSAFVHSVSMSMLFSQNFQRPSVQLLKRS
jgi:hypothetical protein